MKTAIVTGAAGFAGCNLTERLVASGWNVYAVVRPGSAHNDRIKKIPAIHVIDLDLADLSRLPSLVHVSCDAFFHLAWNNAKRDDFDGQCENLHHYIVAVSAAAGLSCKRILFTGSQAEYGLVSGVMTEDLFPRPVNAYGAAKVAACFLTKQYAEQLHIEWIWGRIFSLIGKYEPAGRMLPDLIETLRKGNTPHLSSCTQYWNYLDAQDAADAMIALMECGKTGEIYNIAHCDSKPLRTFTEYVREKIAPEIAIEYGEKAVPYVELQPSVEKILEDTGWHPNFSFEDTINLISCRTHTNSAN